MGIGTVAVGFQRIQTSFGIGDQFSEAGFRFAVFYRPQDGASAHHTVTEPRQFVFGFGGHGVAGIARRWPAERPRASTTTPAKPATTLARSRLERCAHRFKV